MTPGRNQWLDPAARPNGLACCNCCNILVRSELTVEGRWVWMHVRLPNEDDAARDKEQKAMAAALAAKLPNG